MVEFSGGLAVTRPCRPGHGGRRQRRSLPTSLRLRRRSLPGGGPTSARPLSRPVIPRRPFPRCLFRRFPFYELVKGGPGIRVPDDRSVWRVPAVLGPYARAPAGAKLRRHLARKWVVTAAPSAANTGKRSAALRRRSKWRRPVVVHLPPPPPFPGSCAAEKPSFLGHGEIRCRSAS